MYTPTFAFCVKTKKTVYKGNQYVKSTGFMVLLVCIKKIRVTIH